MEDNIDYKKMAESVSKIVEEVKKDKERFLSNFQLTENEKRIISIMINDLQINFVNIYMLNKGFISMVNEDIPRLLEIVKIGLATYLNAMEKSQELSELETDEVKNPENPEIL